jgi:hypothetical protein
MQNGQSLMNDFFPGPHLVQVLAVKGGTIRGRMALRRPDPTRRATRKLPQISDESSPLITPVCARGSTQMAPEFIDIVRIGAAFHDQRRREKEQFVSEVSAWACPDYKAGRSCPSIAHKNHRGKKRKIRRIRESAAVGRRMVSDDASRVIDHGCDRRRCPAARR